MAESIPKVSRQAIRLLMRKLAEAQDGRIRMAIVVSSPEPTSKEEVHRVERCLVKALEEAGLSGSTVIENSIRGAQ